MYSPWPSCRRLHPSPAAEINEDGPFTPIVMYLRFLESRAPAPHRVAGRKGTDWKTIVLGPNPVEMVPRLG
jgi:hypothetical protein